MIKLDHLVKNYGNFCAVDDISFEIQRGEIVGLLGPNGAGKSTMMNILTGYLSATMGDVEVGGMNVLVLFCKARAKVYGFCVNLMFFSFFQ